MSPHWNSLGANTDQREHYEKTETGTQKAPKPSTRWSNLHSLSLNILVTLILLGYVWLYNSEIFNKFICQQNQVC